jgi:hypothetical protein
MYRTAQNPPNPYRFIVGRSPEGAQEMADELGEGHYSSLL